MLVIRQEQIDTLIKGTDDEWVEFLVANAKKEDPEIVNNYDDDTLRRMVRVGIRKSDSYGFTTAKDQSAFVAVMFKVAPNFDQQPEIKAVLDEEQLPPSYRWDKLWSTAVPDEVWEKAKEEYDPEAWKDERR
jgi:hypothetical protein